MSADRRDTGFTPVGQLLTEMIRTTPALQPSKAVTATRPPIVESAEALREARPEAIAFQPSVLCQTSLPYRSTPERRWEAQNGNVMLLVQAGEAYDPTQRQWVELPLPL